MSESIRRLIIKRASAAVIKNQAVSEGMKTLRMVGHRQSARRNHDAGRNLARHGRGPLNADDDSISESFQEGQRPRPGQERAAGRRAEAGCAPLEKPSSERLSKTVMPNATRTLRPRIRLNGGVRAGGCHSTRVARTIALTRRDTSAILPPAVALALEPMSRTRDLARACATSSAQMPHGYIKPIESIDANSPRSC